MTEQITRTLEIVEKEFNDKAAVYKQLVGTLYPSIVYNELYQLFLEYQSMGGNISKLTPVSSPNPEGRASFF